LSGWNTAGKGEKKDAQKGKRLRGRPQAWGGNGKKKLPEGGPLRGVEAWGG